MAETSTTPAKSKKAAKAKKPASHPKYSDMIKAAIVKYASRSGASRQAIQKYVRKSYEVGDNVDVQIKMALKRMVIAGTVRHTRGVGASGSFRLTKPEDSKKSTKAPVLAPAKPKKAAKPSKPKTPKKLPKTPDKIKKTAAKKVRKVVKKATPVKSKKTPSKKAKVAKPKAKPAKRVAKPKPKTKTKTTKKAAKTAKK